MIAFFVVELNLTGTTKPVLQYFDFNSMYTTPSAITPFFFKVAIPLGYRRFYKYKTEISVKL